MDVRRSGLSDAAEGFVRDGYATLERFVKPCELPALREEVESGLRSASGSCERPHNTLVPLRWDDAIVARMLRSRSRRTRLSEILGAGDLRWISGYLSVKEPYSRPLWWHQDWWCWDHPVSFRREAAQVAVLCYLSPTDERIGALRVLPGSHHASTGSTPSSPRRTAATPTAYRRRTRRCGTTRHK